jgi:hypothetical protein
MDDAWLKPLSYFVDASRPEVLDGVAVALESNGRDDPYPAIYVRSGGKVSEHLLPPHPLLDFEGADYQHEAAGLMKKLLESSPARSTQ